MTLKKIKDNHKTVMIIAGINILIFAVVNILFNMKYEQVDDMIMYSLYSGLDGTYSIYGVYMHPVICWVLSLLFRITSVINWHTVFLLVMQFICFTTIGTIIVNKSKSKASHVLYTVFAGICYTSLLLLIQYTSTSALIIATAFFIIMDNLEGYKTEKSSTNNKNEEVVTKIFAMVLFTVGTMIRVQSLLIIAPFFAIYGIYRLVLFIRKRDETNKEKLIILIKEYLILGVLTILIYGSNWLIYNSNDVYKEYLEYNEARTILQDLSYTNYEENKEIFDEIGWTENDHYLFFTFNTGDENIFSKENIQKIVDYKETKGEKYNLNTDWEFVLETLIKQLRETYTYISLLFIASFVAALCTNKKQRIWSITIFVTTLAINVLFIKLNRSMHRVVIPEYILGTAMLLYLIKIRDNTENKEEKPVANSGVIAFLIIVTVLMAGGIYEFGYNILGYRDNKALIEYTNEHKENVYLYTVPSLQFRYLTYSVLEMPPKGAFSNLRVLGGWDMFTQNYYDFKERNNLDGTFLDLLKDNVYLIDGDVTWSGNEYHDYKKHVIQAIKEHYGKDVNCELVKAIGNKYIYKLTEQ